MSLFLPALRVPPDLRWRLVLAFSSIPALSVLYLRRRMPETARYLARLAGDADAAAAVVRHIAGDAPQSRPTVDGRAWRTVFAQHARSILGAALLWLLLILLSIQASCSARH